EPQINCNIPAKCNCDDAHMGKQHFDRVFAMDVDKLYNLVFMEDTDMPSCFLDRVHRSRKSNDLTMNKWMPVNEIERSALVKSCKDFGIYPNLPTMFNLDQVQTRSLSYTVLLNHVMCRSAF